MMVSRIYQRFLQTFPLADNGWSLNKNLVVVHQRALKTQKYSGSIFGLQTNNCIQKQNKEPLHNFVCFFFKKKAYIVNKIHPLKENHKHLS